MQEGVSAETAAYLAAIRQALERKRVSSICRECALASGWDDWALMPEPVVLQFVSGGPGGFAAMAALVCKKCGYSRLYSLPFLGVSLQVEESRIIVPD